MDLISNLYFEQLPHLAGQDALMLAFSISTQIFFLRRLTWTIFQGLQMNFLTYSGYQFKTSEDLICLLLQRSYLLR